MLENLYIKNVALIESVEINFGIGLNILTGETGAGKSMIIDSINFALGERASKDFVRSGTDQAVVEALFKVRNEEYIKVFENLGLDKPEDGEIIISRTVSSEGRTTNRVNGRTVTVSMLKELSQALIDIHGQHEHQSLLNPSKHIILLDKFCAESLNEYKAKMTELLNEYNDVKNKISKLYVNEEEKNRKIDMLQFQINEIGEAELDKNEEEVLNERKKILSNSEKLIRNIYNCINIISNSEEESCVTDLLSNATGYIENVINIDESLNEVYDQLMTASSIIDDASRFLKHYGDSIDSDSDELDNIENRLDLIYKLKRKYGKSIEEILNYYNELSAELDVILNSEVEMKKLNDKKLSLEKEMNVLCDKMTEIRCTKAQEIQSKIENELHDLQMKNAKFKIHFEKKSEFSQNGKDKIEFMISPNMGEDLKPLSKIASGGEMSRVMLAMKNFLSDADNIETFIFDEIDTGVRGRAAQKVGEKMAQIARTHQILCITHLPQIAAMSDSHYLIEKNVCENKTITSVQTLNVDGSIREISRLMGGAEMTETTLKAAKEMKEMAQKMKVKM